MSRLFESFEYLDRGWDVRVLESCSLRRLFVMLFVLTFLLGGNFALTLYAAFRLHHFNLYEGIYMLFWGILAFRYSRVIYRRLNH